MSDLENIKDDESLVSNEEGTGVALGFAEVPEDVRYLFRSFFPSKIGGKPSWLNPRNLPDPKILECKQCKCTLQFLLQLHAPIEKYERSYYRTLYVFMCRKSECCGKEGTLKVLRSQLPQNNQFYNNHQSEENNI